MTDSLTRQLLNSFKLPPQNLASLSFCPVNKPGAVKDWAESLPATRVNHTSALLYKALPEISRLKTTADNRLEMLEALRLYVQQCIQGLTKHFLNQPLLLPEAPMKSAVVAQALQKHMTLGYRAVLADLARKTKASKGDLPKLTLACHRAISGLGLMLLRSYQLYTQTPDKLWLELHSLYRLAEAWGLHEEAVQDSLLQFLPNCSITQAYTRILMLACARPNQLRQTDVFATYEILEEWARLVRIRPYRREQPGALFVVNLAADMAPLYKSRFGETSHELIRELDPSPLLAAFRQRGDRSGGNATLSFPHTISASLASHLEVAWGATQQRSFERRPSRNVVEVCIGLSSLHHHASGGVDFQQFLGAAADLDVSRELEVDLSLASLGWAPRESGSRPSRPEEHPLVTVQVVDSSPGGYCLEWRSEVPAQVKAGEVLGLREQGRHRWGLGVIRWIQQHGGATRTGVQILAPKITPYGAAIEQATGDYSDFRRVLMLPELKAANQAATLITAFAPFQENHRLSLNHQGEITHAVLTRRIFATGSVSQFTFRSAESREQTVESVKNSECDSTWDG